MVSGHQLLPFFFLAVQLLISQGQYITDSIIQKNKKKTVVDKHAPLRLRRRLLPTDQSKTKKKEIPSKRTTTRRRKRTKYNVGWDLQGRSSRTSSNIEELVEWLQKAKLTEIIPLFSVNVHHLPRPPPPPLCPTLKTACDVLNPPPHPPLTHCWGHLRGRAEMNDNRQEVNIKRPTVRMNPPTRTRKVPLWVITTN